MSSGLKRFLAAAARVFAPLHFQAPEGCCAFPAEGSWAARGRRGRGCTCRYLDAAWKLGDLLLLLHVGLHCERQWYAASSCQQRFLSLLVSA